MSAPEKRRPAVSDIALALATRRSDPVSKIELSLNAKGDVQISVDVSDTDPAKAADAASNLFDVLRAKYPRENGVEQYQAEVRRLQDKKRKETK